MNGRNFWALIVAALLLAAVAGAIWTLNRAGPAPEPGVESTNSPPGVPQVLAPVGLEIESDGRPGPYRLTVGDLLGLRAAVELEDGSVRYDAPIAWSSSDPRLASIGADGSLRALSEGNVRIRAELAPLADEVQVSIGE